MRIINYIRKNGLRRAFYVFWNYKVENFLEKSLYIFLKAKRLNNCIMIESHNDFDCNGGAFYNYLIANNYNQKYKIVWLVRKKVKQELPYNVTTVPLHGPSFKKVYYICTVKYVLFDNEAVNKLRNDQIVVYCSHGAGALKNVKGKLFIPDYVNYILTQSKSYMPIQANQWSLSENDKRFVYIGYPSQDTFFADNDKSELLKITNNNYKKILLWMPTFRKGGGYKRNDSGKDQKLGIPLIEDLNCFRELNEYLSINNLFLIIKIHPKQDLTNLGINDLSNITVLTGDKVKELNIDNYKLIKCADALISDYSGAAYDFLQLNRPIGYVLDDLKDYKIGFVVDDICKLMAGHKIYNMKDLYNFISDVLENKDIYKEKRKKLRDYIYNFHDSQSCERLIKLLGINKEEE